MKIVASEQTKLHAELSAEGHALMMKGKNWIESLLDWHRRCRAAGFDNSSLIPKAMMVRLDVLLEGKPVPKLVSMATSLPVPVLKKMAAMPVTIQEEVLADGVKVHRDGKVVTAALENCSVAEVAASLDEREGNGRIVPPEEQLDRRIKHVVRDQKIELWLTADQFKSLERASVSRGKPPKSLIIKLLKDEGLI